MSVLFQQSLYLSPTSCILSNYRVLRACLFDRPDYGQLFSVPNVCNLMLCSLQVLHLVWTYMILSAAFQKVQRGAVSDGHISYVKLNVLVEHEVM